MWYDSSLDQLRCPSVHLSFYIDSHLHSIIIINNERSSSESALSPSDINGLIASEPSEVVIGLWALGWGSLTLKGVVGASLAMRSCKRKCVCAPEKISLMVPRFLCMVGSRLASQSILFYPVKSNWKQLSAVWCQSVQVGMAITRDMHVACASQSRLDWSYK